MSRYNKLRTSKAKNYICSKQNEKYELLCFHFSTDNFPLAAHIWKATIVTSAVQTVTIIKINNALLPIKNNKEKRDSFKLDSFELGSQQLHVGLSGA